MWNPFRRKQPVPGPGPIDKSEAWDAGVPRWLMQPGWHPTLEQWDRINAKKITWDEAMEEAVADGTYFDPISDHYRDHPEDSPFNRKP